MIFVFHTLYFVLKFALKIYKKHKALKEFQRCKEERLEEEAKLLEVDLEQCLSFDPPVYRQRYATVQEVLLDSRWHKDMKRIVDFGCAELGFFQYLKHLLVVREILEVDIDEALIKEHAYRVQPLTADYLKQRSDPLVVNLLCGSIGDPDYRLKNIDAVVAIEIIEHLYPDTLDEICFNIFGYVKPRVAIFTTPNADFNVLFPNFNGFRHDDHKFEWTRQQFSDWAQNVVVRFPEFSVTIQGIGKGPKGTESFGCCSQMAVFVREPQPTQEILYHEGDTQTSFGVCTYYSYVKHLTEFGRTEDVINCDNSEPNSYYKLVETINYPFVEDNRSPDQKLLDMALYCIYMNASANSRYYNEESNMVEVPLYEICQNFDGYFTSIEEMRRILEKAEYTIKECLIYGSNEVHPCVVYDVDMDKRSSTPTTDNKSEYEYALNNASGHETESDWEPEFRPPNNLAIELKEEEDAVEPSEKLYDSGYQKSISNAEWSPQSPMDGVFEEQFNNFVKMDVNDIKEQAKVKLVGDLNPLKQPNNKLLSEKRIPSTSSRKSPTKESLPSTSDPKRRKKCHKPGEGSDDGASSDVKIITDCILYNSLNKLDVDDEVAPVVPLPIPIQIPDPEIPYVVENGDLANNNRDNEGNNYPEPPEPELFNFIDVDDDDEINENRDVINNLEIQAEVHQNVDQDQENQNLPEVIVQDEAVVVAAEEPLEAVQMLNLRHASREALFDPDSQQDMLDDLSIPESHSNLDPLLVPDDEDDDEPILVGVRLTSENNDNALSQSEFPNWLLHILGHPAEDDEIHDEPHFYCQGDGIGVHPSMIEVDVEESSSESSSNDDAEAEQTLSEDDVLTLPVDSNAVPMPPIFEVVGVNIPLHASYSAVSNDSNEEFFDTIEDSSGGNFEDEGKK